MAPMINTKDNKVNLKLFLYDLFFINLIRFSLMLTRQFLMAFLIKNIKAESKES